MESPDLSVVFQIIIICGHDNDQNQHSIIHYPIKISIFKMYLLKKFLPSATQSSICFKLTSLICLCHGLLRAKFLHLSYQTPSSMLYAKIIDFVLELMRCGQKFIFLSREDYNSKQMDEAQQRWNSTARFALTHCWHVSTCNTALC